MSALLTREGTHAGTTQPTTAARRGWLRGALHQIRQAVGEINYASHRMVEVQAPWTVDKQWYSK
jgi:hypothetical protein